MKITHLQSSSELIEAGGVRILTDPWLVQGEYYGSWYHYPPLPMDVDSLDYDAIYVSHIHPDHLSRKTFQRLDRRKPVLIHRFEEKFLKRNIEAMGFTVVELDHGVPHDLGGGASIEIYAADNCDPELCAKFIGCAPVESAFRFTQIDSLAVITDGTHTVLNTNDCPFDLSRTVIERVKRRHPVIDLMLVGYAGAGPYPQCFTFADDAGRRAAAARKEAQFIAQAVRYVDAVQPRAFMPFAGTYVLGGRLGPLNGTRGVPSLAEALARIEAGISVESRGFLLPAGESFDFGSEEVSAAYREPAAEEVAAFVASTAGAPYDYDDVEDVGDAALFDALSAAHPRFAAKARDIGFDSPTRIVVRDGNGFAAAFDAVNGPEPVEAMPEAGFVEITVDRRLLQQLLKGPRFAHWNNAEIGSHLHYRRVPDTFERGLYYCLSALHV
ncbi:MBL fold metallo-hydrolase [Oceaniglobus roseus]|uniref:MBL fold metallo-hydrolase n=1 Tax=Oceaniglobus roseus TaxID=1737570 RepID=UPI000C7EAC90|nr:MBL fold metallo-hydrolase [Kandeliimicrobium roseum]